MSQDFGSIFGVKRVRATDSAERTERKAGMTAPNVSGNIVKAIRRGPVVLRARLQSNTYRTPKMLPARASLGRVAVDGNRQNPGHERVDVPRVKER
jgi:hypothetical protein